MKLTSFPTLLVLLILSSFMLTRAGFETKGIDVMDTRQKVKKSLDWSEVNARRRRHLSPRVLKILSQQIYDRIANK